MPENAKADAHAKYVAAGGCGYVWQKTWCNGSAGHVGPHWATHVLPQGDARRVELPGIDMDEVRRLRERVPLPTPTLSYAEAFDEFAQHVAEHYRDGLKAGERVEITATGTWTSADQAFAAWWKPTGDVPGALEAAFREAFNAGRSSAFDSVRGFVPVSPKADTE